MLSRRIFLASILAAALLATGCLKEAIKEATANLSELATVRSALVKRFGDEVNVYVNHNGGRSVLTVTFINSPLNDKTRDERLKRALEAARVVTMNYSRGKNLDVIWIGFARVKTQFIVFHQSQMFDFFPFEPNGAPIDPAKRTTDYHASGGPLDTTVGYMSNTDESDISISGIQLEGEPGGLGITVLPHFKVQGNAEEQLARPPKDVAFDFASYSEKPRFLTDKTPISFIGGGRVIFQTQAKFNGNDAQFCYVSVPYPAFKKMVEGSDLTIKLGDKEYPLTPRQFAAIQKMHTYLTE